MGHRGLAGQRRQARRVPHVLLAPQAAEIASLQPLQQGRAYLAHG